MLLRKPDTTAVPELWVRTDSTHGEWCYLGQLVYHITQCARTGTQLSEKCEREKRAWRKKNCKKEKGHFFNSLSTEQEGILSF